MAPFGLVFEGRTGGAVAPPSRPLTPLYNRYSGSTGILRVLDGLEARPTVLKEEMDTARGL
jgi:hypothetical protein